MVNRIALLMAVVMVLALGGGSTQAQEGVDLTELADVVLTYADDSHVYCVTDVLDNGWSGGMFVPADRAMPITYASCNVAYDMMDVVGITFSPRANPDLVVELTCDEGFVPDSPEKFCRPLQAH